MRCEFCDGETIKKKVKKHHWYNGKLYIIEDVDAEVCQKCGEKYYHIKTLKGINKMLSKDHDVKEHLDVEVVSYAS